ncbi:hypothetical protein P43SY_008860 [Pythium insidiosum]|uniref:Glycosyl transferase family 1 domain-containing protein n=1 Tax=Pythium insidiosum TaxID=114742 RepID=A0AAD5LMT8_PYTIN|nr:hypothetical protein P43SY_008860 [Pythium insidiosum]
MMMMTIFRLLVLALASRFLQSAAAVSADAALASTVIWYAPFLSGGGYCSEAHSYIAAMEEALHELQERRRQPTAAAGKPANGHLSSASDSSRGEDDDAVAQEDRPFSLFVTQHGDSYNAAFIRDLPDSMRKLMENAKRDFHWRLKHKTIALAICHSEPGAWHPPRYSTSRCPPRDARYTVGRTMFETDRVPKGWSDRMNKMDEIWVPTRFQEKIFRDGGVSAERLRVLPEAVDVDFFDPARVETPYDLAKEITGRTITPTTTIFLSIFKWEERKAWRVLLKAYFQAFTKDDDVVLAILTKLGQSLDELPLVHMVSPNLPQNQLPALYKAATAFVLPSRGEGWGRPHVEAMSMELPIIATFWSGTTEYMTEENSYPLNIEGLVEVYGVAVLDDSMLLTVVVLA